jgi:SAM-dependent methyltransferase
MELLKRQRSTHSGVTPAVADPDFERQSASAYNIVAGYEVNPTKFMINPDEFPDLDLFIGLLGNLSEKTILDVGCGFGRHSPYFRAREVGYVGMDTSGVSLKKAREYYPEATFVHSSLTNIAFQEETFDGFWSVMSLHHHPKKFFQSALQSLHATIKGGGVGYIILPYGEYDGQLTSSMHRHLQNHVSAYLPDELVHEVTRASFTVIEASVEELAVNNWAPTNRILVRK